MTGSAILIIQLMWDLSLPSLHRSLYLSFSLLGDGNGDWGKQTEVFYRCGYYLYNVPWVQLNFGGKRYGTQCSVASDIGSDELVRDADIVLQHGMNVFSKFCGSLYICLLVFRFHANVRYKFRCLGSLYHIRYGLMHICMHDWGCRNTPREELANFSRSSSWRRTGCAYLMLDMFEVTSVTTFCRTWRITIRIDILLCSIRYCWSWAIMCSSSLLDPVLGLVLFWSISNFGILFLFIVNRHLHFRDTASFQITW